MKPPSAIGTVVELASGQVAFAPIAKLLLAGGTPALDSAATVYDAPVPTCLRLERLANGSLQVSLYGNTLNEVMRGGVAALFADIGRTGVAAEIAARYAPRYNEAIRAFAQSLAFGPKRLEIGDRGINGVAN